MVLDPNNGEIITLASYPRFDPNDFISGIVRSSRRRIRWLENEAYLAKVWNGALHLQRELIHDAVSGEF